MDGLVIIVASKKVPGAAAWCPDGTREGGLVGKYATALAGYKGKRFGGLYAEALEIMKVERAAGDWCRAHPDLVYVDTTNEYVVVTQDAVDVFVAHLNDALRTAKLEAEPRWMRMARNAGWTPPKDGGG